MTRYKCVIKGNDNGTDIIIKVPNEYLDNLFDSLVFTMTNFAYTYEIPQKKLLEIVKDKYKQILENDYKNNENND